MGRRPARLRLALDARAAWRRRRARAYGTDLGQLAEWADAPRARAVRARPARAAPLRRRDLRARGRRSRTVARKLAAIRAFYRHLVERGVLEAQPGRPGRDAEAGPYLPARPEAGRGRPAARRDAGGDAARAARPRACSSSPTAAGLRAEELVNLDLDRLDPDAEELRVDGKGRRRASFPPASRPGGRSRLPRARPPEAAALRRRPPRASPRCSSRSTAGASRHRTSAAG